MLPHSPSASGLWASTRATLLHTAEEAPLCPGEPSRILLTDKPLVRPELTPGSEKATALQVKMVRCGHLDPTPSPKLHPQQKSETQRGHTMLRKQGYCAGPQRGKQRPGNEVRNETEHRAEVGRPEQQSREQWGDGPTTRDPALSQEPCPGRGAEFGGQEKDWGLRHQGSEMGIHALLRPHHGERDPDTDLRRSCARLPGQPHATRRGTGPSRTGMTGRQPARNGGTDMSHGTDKRQRRPCHRCSGLLGRPCPGTGRWGRGAYPRAHRLTVLAARGLRPGCLQAGSPESHEAFPHSS